MLNLANIRTAQSEFKHILRFNWCYTIWNVFGTLYASQVENLGGEGEGKERNFEEIDLELQRLSLLVLICLQKEFK